MGKSLTRKEAKKILLSGGKVSHSFMCGTHKITYSFYFDKDSLNLHHTDGSGSVDLTEYDTFEEYEERD